jgi:hypothetical protein
MQLAISAIILRSYYSAQSGTTPLTFFDLSTNRECSITLRETEVKLIDGHDLVPRNYVLDGVEFFKGDKGLYVSARTLVNSDQPRSSKSA